MEKAQLTPTNEQSPLVHSDATPLSRPRSLLLGIKQALFTGAVCGGLLYAALIAVDFFAVYMKLSDPMVIKWAVLAIMLWSQARLYLRHGWDRILTKRGQDTRAREFVRFVMSGVYIGSFLCIIVVTGFQISPNITFVKAYVFTVCIALSAYAWFLISMNLEWPYEETP